MAVEYFTFARRELIAVVIQECLVVRSVNIGRRLNRGFGRASDALVGCRCVVLLGGHLASHLLRKPLSWWISYLHQTAHNDCQPQLGGFPLV